MLVEAESKAAPLPAPTLASRPHHLEWAHIRPGTLPPRVVDLNVPIRSPVCASSRARPRAGADIQQGSAEQTGYDFSSRDRYGEPASYPWNPDAEHPPFRPRDQRRIAVARPLGAIRIDAARRLPPLARRVDGPVLDDIPDGVEGPAWRLEQVRVVAVGEDRPPAVHHLVQGAGHPHLEPLHRAPERHGVRRLDDVVHVVALHREVHQAEPEALASARKRALEGAEAAMRPQVPDLLADPDGDVERTVTKLPARPVRDVLAPGLSLAAGAPPGTAPARQWELLLDRVHSRSVREGSDTAANARTMGMPPDE